MDQATTIDRATQALYATASEPYRPRAVKAIVALMIVTVVLLAMVPIFASSIRPSNETSTTASAAIEQSTTTTIPSQATMTAPPVSSGTP